MDKLIKNDESLSKWLINNYNRYFKTKSKDITSIIKDLYHRGFDDNRIIELTKAPNYMSGVAFI